jgi:hypothetical protein
MPTDIHFIRRDQDFAVREGLEAVAAAASAGGPIRLTSLTHGVVFVNWANVLYIEEVAEGVLAADG